MTTKSEQRAFEHNRAKIRGWLIKEGYSIQDMDDAKTAWAILATEKEGEMNFGFAVSQPIGRPEIVAVAMTLPLLDYRSRYNQLSAKERRAFNYDLRFRLLGMDSEFHFPGDTFDYVTLSNHLHIDELREGFFWRKVHGIRKAVLAVLWTYELKFDDPSSGQPPTFTLGSSNN